MESRGPQVINVSDKNRELFKNIDIFKYRDEDNIEKEIDLKYQFLFAMAYGFLKDHKVPFGKKSGKKSTKKWIIRTSYLLEDEYLLDAIALHDTNDIKVLSDRNKVIEIAEQYANGGIELLDKEAKATQFASFDKRIEKIMRDVYSKIVD